MKRLICLAALLFVGCDHDGPMSPSRQKIQPVPLVVPTPPVVVVICHDNRDGCKH